MDSPIVIGIVDTREFKSEPIDDGEPYWSGEFDEAPVVKKEEAKVEPPDYTVPLSIEIPDPWLNLHGMQQPDYQVSTFPTPNSFFSQPVLTSSSADPDHWNGYESSPSPDDPPSIDHHSSIGQLQPARNEMPEYGRDCNVKTDVRRSLVIHSMYPKPASSRAAAQSFRQHVSVPRSSAIGRLASPLPTLPIILDGRSKKKHHLSEGAEKRFHDEAAAVNLNITREQMITLDRRSFTEWTASLSEEQRAMAHRLRKRCLTAESQYKIYRTMKLQQSTTRRVVRPPPLSNARELFERTCDCSGLSIDYDEFAQMSERSFTTWKETLSDKQRLTVEFLSKMARSEEARKRERKMRAYLEYIGLFDL